MALSKLVVVVFRVLPLSLWAIRSCHAEKHLDEELHEIRKTYGGVALAGISLDSQGTICAAGADGERILGSNVPVDAVDGRWQIGSCTKSMTAVLVAIMLEEGSFGNGINWNSTLADIVPASWSCEESSYSTVTIQQLLSMASGLARDPPDGWETYEGDKTLPLKQQREAAARGALMSKPVNMPGTTFLYSNWGYVLAGAILEAYTGKLWEELVSEWIFEPLGIEIDLNMDFGVPRGENDPWGHIAGIFYGYKACNPFQKACGYRPVIGPCGGFTGNSRAMVAYLAWHMRCHNGMSRDGDPKLSAAACRKLHTPVDPLISNYALGWTCVEQVWAGKKVLACSHYGSIGYWIYHVWISPGMDRAFISTTNSRRNKFQSMVEMTTTDKAVVMMIESNITCDSGKEWLVEVN